ncbi:geranylgeranylglycerol-phosphate geranylgeranyltransferase [Flavobacteriales bacterium]|nr:geranylgeranylglycerol-phosphate geranylgeranyltransferase [Flavobacteriales bacterium]
MRTLFNFFKLLRPINLFILILICITIKFGLINQFIIKPALSDFNFFLFLISTLLVTGSGYIINDIYDEKVDKINKDHKRIINKEINSKSAIIWYFLFNFLALLIIVHVAIVIEKIIFSLIFLYSIFILWRYSKLLKYTFLRGNLVVSCLVALSILNIGLFDIVPVINNDNSSKIIFLIIIVYSLFAFLMTFSREIIKDLEDAEGDKIYGANTIALSLGIHKSKRIINSVNLIVLFFIAFWQYFQYSLYLTRFDTINNEQIEIWGTDNLSILYIALLQFSLIYFIIKCYFAKEKVDFFHLSNISKYIMLFGIISIIIFTIDYQDLSFRDIIIECLNTLKKLITL